MAKSFFEKLARGLGRATGKLAEKAREQGLDKKAGELLAAAKERLSDMASEYEDGRKEAGRREDEGEGAAKGEEPGVPEEDREPETRGEDDEPKAASEDGDPDVEEEPPANDRTDF